jgi:transposase
MPTLPRRPAAQQERESLQARRLRAAELFAAGLRQAEAARQLRVSRQSVQSWHARWAHGGAEALRSRGPTGPTPRLSDRQLGQVEHFLLQGATANGFVGELMLL